MTPEMEPVDVVRRWYETFDPALLADEIEWNVLPSWPGGGRRVGRRGVEEFFAAVGATFAEYAARFDDIWVTGGEVVVTRGAYRGRVHPDAAAFEVPFVHLWHVRGGRILRLDQVADTAAMRDVLGRSGAGAPAA